MQGNTDGVLHPCMAEASLSMIELDTDGVNEIELCSGEHRRWRYVRPDSYSSVWWRDLETGSEFSEASLMYVWQIIRKHEEPAAGEYSTMPNQIPPSTPAINRLRAAAALIPIIESGFLESRLSVERAVLMASFCE